MEILEKRIKDVSAILLSLRDMETTRNGEPFNEVHRLRYEHEFIFLNFDIQNIRAENENVIDAIRSRHADVKKLDAAIKDKKELIARIDEKIAKSSQPSKSKK